MDVGTETPQSPGPTETGGLRVPRASPTATTTAEQGRRAGTEREGLHVLVWGQLGQVTGERWWLRTMWGAPRCVPSVLPGSASSRWLPWLTHKAGGSGASWHAGGCRCGDRSETGEEQDLWPCRRGRGALTQGCTAQSHQQRLSPQGTQAVQGGSSPAPNPDLGQSCSSKCSWPGGRDRRGWRDAGERCRCRAAAPLARIPWQRIPVPSPWGQTPQ